MSSSDSRSLPAAEARSLLGIIAVLIRIDWCVAVAFFFMFRSINQEWSNPCHRVFAEKNAMLLMVSLCFYSIIPSLVSAQFLRFCLDPVAGRLEEKKEMLNWVRLGVDFCLVSSWLGVSAMMMWAQMLIANTIDCKNPSFYDFSVAAAFVTNLGVLVFYLVLGSHVRRP